MDVPMGELTEKSERLLLFGSGDAPIILSVPHGGDRPIPGIEGVRCAPHNPGPWRFATDTDFNTIALTQHIRERMMSLGVVPYMVISHVLRRDLDLNRTWEHNLHGYDDDQVDEESIELARNAFAGFHKRLAGYIDDMKSIFPPAVADRCFLLGIHGTHLPPGYDIELGTLNGASAMAELVYPIGGVALDLWTAFERRGFALAGEPDPESEVHRGCFVSARHGLGGRGGVNAVLVEVARPLRHRDRVADTGRRMGEALAGFVRETLLGKR